MAAAGASVAMNYASDRRGAEAVVAAITAPGGRAIVFQGDVSKSADVAPLFVEVKAAYGALDVLVNNAAVYKLDPLEKVTEEEFHRVWLGVRRQSSNGCSDTSGVELHPI